VSAAPGLLLWLPFRKPWAETLKSFGTLILAKNAVWTIGGYGFGQFIRFASNLILTRLLAPELFGVMLIVNTLRTGTELFTDLGIGQNIVYNKNGEDPSFYNTAWSLQLIRGFALCVIGCIAAWPVSSYYHTQILLAVIPVASIVFIISGFMSVSPFMLKRKLLSAKLNVFEVGTLLAGSISQVLLSYFYPTVWSLVFGLLVGTAIHTIASHFLLPDIRHRVMLIQPYLSQITQFGRWIFFASIIYFLSMSFDRLYLASVLPLSLLGVYGIARSISDMISLMIIRLADNVIFPFVASRSQTSGHELRASLSKPRLVFLLVTALGLSLLAAGSDLLINTLFDQRYRDASWMCSVLIIGTWFSVISSLAEGALLGFGKPLYAAIGNGAKFTWLLFLLPIGFSHYGAAGAIAVVATADLFRYIPLLIGQFRERFVFGAQDGLGTAVAFGLMAFWECLRWRLGLGTSFDFLAF
jgi:O-antigen/teichoic acid export membrane protein